MKRICLLTLVFALALSQVVQALTARIGLVQDETKSVTLYASNKYKHGPNRALLSFKTGTLAQSDWDLDYGSLYVGDDLDWFSVSTETDARSAARDLGELNWGDYVSVPIIEPFPKLKEGQTRTFKVDASGADGADGEDGEDAIDGDGQVRHRPRRPGENMAKHLRKEKRSGVPKVDPIFVKAVLGHMYVLRVVDDNSDFYVLFRVDALERGDNCTISWKRIPPPPEEMADDK